MSGLSLVTRGYICSAMQSAVNQVPLGPNEGLSLLKKALILPLPKSMTEAQGIVQSDILIRSALIAAISDLRANPYLLQYCFASLVNDSLTWQEYGEKERSNSIDWFTKTDIPVFLDIKQTEPIFPCISITLVDSTEAEATLADTHYITREDVKSEWPILLGPLDPTAYSAGTGILIIPNSELILSKSMNIVDKLGKVHPILDILDKNTIIIKPGTIADFSGCTVRSARPTSTIDIESLSFKEVYRIGCFASGEPVYLSYLHSIVSFCLLRYKEALLEARGLERTTMTSSQVAQDQNYNPEIVFSRYITLTGYVRNYWPKLVKSKILTMGTELLVNDQGLDNVGLASENGRITGDESWLVERDAITGEKIE